MPTRTPSHGNTEETRMLIQPTDGPTHLVDSLKEPEKTSLTRTLMKKSGDLSTPTRTPSHGNTEETRMLIQPTDGPTHQVDLHLIKRTPRPKILETRKLMRKFGDLLKPIKILYQLNKEEMMKLIQQTVMITQKADSH